MLQVLLKLVDQEDQVEVVELLIYLIQEEQEDLVMKEDLLYQKEIREDKVQRHQVLLIVN